MTIMLFLLNWGKVFGLVTALKSTNNSTSYVVATQDGNHPSVRSALNHCPVFHLLGSLRIAAHYLADWEHFYKARAVLLLAVQRVISDCRFHSAFCSRSHSSQDTIKVTVFLTGGSEHKDQQQKVSSNSCEISNIHRTSNPAAHLVVRLTAAVGAPHALHVS